jgi:hypothetical protein
MGSTLWEILRLGFHLNSSDSKISRMFERLFFSGSFDLPRMICTVCLTHVLCVLNFFFFSVLRMEPRALCFHPIPPLLHVFYVAFLFSERDPSTSSCFLVGMQSCTKLVSFSHLPLNHYTQEWWLSLIFFWHPACPYFMQILWLQSCQVWFGSKNNL